MSEATEAEFKPNYGVECCVCGQTPTVDIYVKGKLESHMEMCGPCTWGEADTIDPENWWPSSAGCGRCCTARSSRTTSLSGNDLRRGMRRLMRKACGATPNARGTYMVPKPEISTGLST